MDRVLNALRAAGCRGGGSSWTCPAHDDTSPSLSVSRADRVDGVVLNCHAGCQPEDVLEVLGLTPADLFDAPRFSDRGGRREVTRYPYTDESGALLFYKIRYDPKAFRQQQANGRWNLTGVRRVLYRLPEVRAAVAEGRAVWVVEGEKDADRMTSAGVVATTWPDGAWQPGSASKWRPEYTEQLRGASSVTIVADDDQPGLHTAWAIADALTAIGVPVRVVGTVAGKDAYDHLTAGHPVEAFRPLTRPDGGAGSQMPAPSEQTTGTVDPIGLDECHAVFRRWLGAGYDMDALDAVLAAAAVERLDGDPVWLLLVSGPGFAKTETVAALAGAGAVLASSISSEGALLSATPRAESAKDATGGLLRNLGPRGVLVVKDVTSILSANRETRAAVLAALWEVYDGRWDRNVGTEGGRTLTWQGRIVVVGAVTTAWDSAHSVVSAMGDRFALIRVDSADPDSRLAAGRQALDNVGSEVQMRRELADAVGGVLAGLGAEPSGVALTAAEQDELLAAANLVTLARTAVDCDAKGNPERAHAPEAPTRFAKSLAQIARGLIALGADRGRALTLALRVARDSTPPLRLQLLEHLADHPHDTVTEVRRTLQLPHTTVDRGLQALHLLGLVVLDEYTEPDGNKRRTTWRYAVAAGWDVSVLAAPRETFPEMSVGTPYPPEGATGRGPQPGTDVSGKHVHAPPSPTDISGRAPTPTEGHVWDPPAVARAVLRGYDR